MSRVRRAASAAAAVHTAGDPSRAVQAVVAASSPRPCPSAHLRLGHTRVSHHQAVEVATQVRAVGQLALAATRQQQHLRAHSREGGEGQQQQTLKSDATA